MHRSKQTKSMSCLLFAALTSCQLLQHMAATSHFKGTPNFILGQLWEHLKHQLAGSWACPRGANNCQLIATEMLVARLVCLSMCQKTQPIDSSRHFHLLGNLLAPRTSPHGHRDPNLPITTTTFGQHSPMQSPP